MKGHPYRPYQVRTGTSGINPYQPYIGTDTNTNKRSRSLGTDTEETDPVRTRARSRVDWQPSYDRAIETSWEAWAAAAVAEPGLAYLHLLAVDLRQQRGCRASDWSALVDLLLDLDLPAELYDLAVDTYHHAADMPCGCMHCVARWEDGQIVARRSAKRRGGSVFDAGRYRLRPGF